MDLLYNRWSPRSQKISDTTTFLALGLFIFIFAQAAIGMAWESTSIKESYMNYAFHGPIWPGKVIMAISAILLALQGIAIFTRNIRDLVINRRKEIGRAQKDTQEL